MSKPLTSSYANYFQQYVNQVSEENLLIAFENQQPVMQAFLMAISEEKSTHKYAPNKWTIKEILQHLIDTERIFAYRALCFARKETTPLPGFEEDDYAASSNANQRTWKDLVEELLAVRHTTLLLFQSFTEEALTYTGTASNNPLTVNSIGFITLGHFYHHKRIMEERYFVTGL